MSNAARAPMRIEDLASLKGDPALEHRWLCHPDRECADGCDCAPIAERLAVYTAELPARGAVHRIERWNLNPQDESPLCGVWASECFTTRTIYPEAVTCAACLALQAARPA